MNKELLLYYMCDENYDYFIPLFCYFANWSNPEAKIEIHTPDIEQFELLTRLYDVEFFPLEKGLKSINMLRFITEPKRKATYTYIGDIDILLLNNVMWAHQHLVSNEVPVCNLKRANSERATGLQFVKTDPYFKDTRKLREGLAEWMYPYYNDENMLYKLIDGVYGIGILTELNTEMIRPILGIHCSPNRTPEGDPGWGLVPSSTRRLKAVELLARAEFKPIEEMLDPKAQKIVNYLRHPEEGWEIIEGVDNSSTPLSDESVDP